MQSSDPTETLMEFPCTFAVKAMGKADPDFDALILEIIRRHAPDAGPQSLSTRPSSGGKWLAVTVTIQATGKAQLDAIYQELSDHERVVMAL